MPTSGNVNKPLRRALAVAAGSAGLWLALVPAIHAKPADAPVAAPTATSTGSSSVCVQNSSATTCPGDEVGTVTWQSLPTGEFLLHAVAATGTRWGGLFVCVPYPGQGQGADCAGSTNDDGSYSDGSELLQPGADYSVAGVSGQPAYGPTTKNASFACDSDFTVTVSAAVMANVTTNFTWAAHLIPSGCGQNDTHEVFGVTTKASPDTGGDTGSGSDTGSSGDTGSDSSSGTGSGGDTGSGRWDPLESTCRHASLSIL